MFKLMKGRYSSIKSVLNQRLRKTPDPAEDLIGRLSHVKRQGYFNRSEFLAMCSWKSPRPRHLYESNSSAKIRRVSIDLFAAKCERQRVELLTSLKGVGVPTASAILTLTDPQDYGVIDIRVWQLLHRCGAVRTRPSGAGFTCENWLEFLERLRDWAREFDVTVRDVERALFDYHRDNQEGTLYPPRAARK